MIDSASPDNKNAAYQSLRELWDPAFFLDLRQPNCPDGLVALRPRLTTGLLLSDPAKLSRNRAYYKLT